MPDEDDFLNQAPIANIANADDTNLSQTEKDLIIATWNEGITDLKKLVQTVCGPDVDGRSKRGIAVKNFLASRNLSANPANIYKKKTDYIELTESQKEFIANNVANMKLLEVTKTIFDNPTLTNLSSEFRAIKAYYDTLDSKVKTADNDDLDVKDYNPPKSDIQATARINKYVLGGIDTENVTPKQRECVQKLIRYMHTFRFLYEMKNLTRTSEREMFESSFVRYCWDKPDLTEEDIDLYLNLCSEQILYERMKKELAFLTEQRDMMMSGEDGRLPMPLVEAIGKLRGDLDASSKKQEKTLQGLNGNRSKRLEKINADNLGLLSLVEAVRDAEKRKRMAAVFEIRKNRIRTEANRLEDLGEDVFEIFGATKLELTE